MEEKIKNDQEDTAAEPGFFRETLQFVLIALAIALPIRFFIAQPFIVSGGSMIPTFANGDYLIVDQLTYYFEDPKRGDVIVFHNPGNQSEFYIKRIIGLPGETVRIEGKSIVITNTEHPEGIRLQEPYIRAEHGGAQDVALGENNYFVMGDNRDASSDSRIWGALDRNLIAGRAFLRLWPPSAIDAFPGRANPETGIVF